MPHARRYFIAAAVTAIILAVFALTAYTMLARRAERTVIFAMDTRITITAYGTHAKTAIAAAEERLRELERLWSVTDPESEIFAINHSGGSRTAVSHETAEILTFALDTAHKTKGAFDPTIYPVLTAWGFTTGEYKIPTDAELSVLLPFVGYNKATLDGSEVTVPEGTMLDLGAVAKGRAADLAAEVMTERGVGSALIDLGGNVLAIGTKPGGTLWRVGIKDPFGDGNIGVVEIEALSVVTSGGYERYFTDADGEVFWHVIDPISGKPARSGLSSATVISPSSALCDALSTALFVMGLDAAGEFWREHGDFEMILVTDEGGIYITEGLEGRFVLTENYAADAPVVIRP